MKKGIAINELKWSEVRHKVLNVNPQLAKIIDNLSVDDRHTVLTAKYPYGSQVLKNGQLFLPTNDKRLVPISDALVNPKLRDQLGYVINTNPVTLVLKNTLELFFHVEDRIIPYSLVEEGMIFGIWAALEPLQGICFFPCFLYGR